MAAVSISYLYNFAASVSHEKISSRLCNIYKCMPNYSMNASSYNYYVTAFEKKSLVYLTIIQSFT